MDLSKILKATEYSDSGRHKYRLSDYSGAIKDFDKAIENDSTIGEYYLERGLAKDKISDYRGAIEDFDKAIEINPNQDVPYYRWPNEDVSDDGYHYRNPKLSDFTHFINPVDKTRTINPNYAKRLPTINDLLPNLREPSKELDKRIHVYINHYGAFYHRGIAKSELSDYSGAIEDFNKAIEIDPNIEVFYCNRGIAKSKLSDYNGAIEDFNKAIKISPDYEEAHYYLGIAKNSLGNK